MKKFYATTTLLLIVFLANAKIWRVNNNTGVAADFTTAQAAHDGSAAGDTLHFEPSISAYGNLTMTKRLVLIGIGDLLGINPNQQASGIPARLSDITISNAGAANSVIMVPFNYMNINNVPDVVIQRCYISNRIDAGNADNLVLRNCYFQTYVSIYSGSNNVLIHNNIFLNQVDIDNSSSATILNNIIAGSGNNSTINNSTVRSNIFVNGGGFFTASGVQNNLTSGANLPAGNGNQTSINMSTVFINHTSTNDKDYQLAASSPAIGAGFGGIDAGAFGGSSPYVLSVQPNIPAIYKLLAPPSVSGSTMNVTISTKSNN